MGGMSQQGAADSVSEISETYSLFTGGVFARMKMLGRDKVKNIL